MEAVEGITNFSLEEKMVRTVTIKECHSNGISQTTRVRTDDPLEARSRAIVKLYGKRGSFFLDRELVHNDHVCYGRMAVPTGINSYSFITDRIEITVE